MLVFDVKVLNDAQKYAEENEIKIFTANIIYHLTDFFVKYVEQVKEERRIKEGKEAVFPCVLKQVATFRKSDPIVLGVDVESGVIKVGTPITIYREKEVTIVLGRREKSTLSWAWSSPSSITTKNSNRPARLREAWPFRSGATRASWQGGSSSKPTDWYPSSPGGLLTASRNTTATRPPKRNGNSSSNSRNTSASTDPLCVPTLLYSTPYLYHYNSHERTRRGRG